MAAVSVLSVPVRFEHEFPPPHDAGPDAYVDLTMRLPTPHDALFRLGLVRLQEHARPDRRGAPREGARAGIRLSAPASIQGSVPPPRRFGVSVTPLDTRHGATGAVSLVGVTLAGPAAADGRGVASRRVRMELRERRGNEELPVTDQDARDAALLWVGGGGASGHRAPRIRKRGTLDRCVSSAGRRAARGTGYRGKNRGRGLAAALPGRGTIGRAAALPRHGAFAGGTMTILARSSSESLTARGSTISDWTKLELLVNEDGLSSATATFLRHILY
jgi:hypothetical protein